jgi:DNA gyrase subunit A
MNIMDVNTHLTDLVIDLNARNKSNFLLFTNQGRLFKWYNRRKIELMLDTPSFDWNNEVSLEQSEKIIYGTGTNDYSGYMIFAFTNGKVAKISMTAYETKNERTCLVNAFHTDATLIFIKHIPADLDLIIYSSLKKILVFNTEIINPLATKNSAGVQILKLRDHTIAAGVKLIPEVTIQDLNYYKRSQAAIGYYQKPGDSVF